MAKSNEVKVAIIGGIVTVTVALIAILPGWLNGTDDAPGKTGPAPNASVAASADETAAGNASVAATNDQTAAASKGAPGPGRTREQPTPLGVEGDRPIRFRNDCSEPLTLWLAYQTPSGWIGDRDASWPYQPGAEFYVASNGVSLRATSDMVYLNARSASGAEWRGTVAKEELQRLMPYRMSVNPQGDYVIRLGCPG